jgi:outer membrane murein-binding lipoprotein Lpp
MFDTLEGTVDQALERRREARRREVRAICEEQARLAQRLTEIVREADDDGDWQAAGCASSTQWLAQVASSDHRTAAQITRTSSALRNLPALDQALSAGVLTLDQVAAAAEFATPDSDADGSVRRSPATLIVHVSNDAPPRLELLHDRHIHTSGTSLQPVFTDHDGRAITTNQPHAPPTA